MIVSTVTMGLRGINGADILDLAGSLAVFGYLTAYALVAAALPFARRAVGQHSLRIAAVSIVTVAAMFLIVIYDLLSATDPAHARIPYIYILYLVAGIAWYKMKRKNPAAPVAD